MISSDVGLGLAVFFFYLAMMLWGVFQTFWPAEPRVSPPNGGHKIRKGQNQKPAPVPARVSLKQ